MPEYKLKYIAQEILDEVLRLYLEEKLSLIKVSKLTGVGFGTVRKYLKQENIPIRNDKKLFTPEQKQQMINLYNTPASLKTVAKEFNCDVKSITNAMDSIGFKRRETSKQLTNPYKDNPAFRERRRNELRGENSVNWKGGVSDLQYAIRCLPEYRIWRSAVFARDKFTCQHCGKQSTENEKVMLHAHHIQYLDYIIKAYNLKNTIEAINCGKLWDVSNGKVLCSSCHTVWHKSDEI